MPIPHLGYTMALIKRDGQSPRLYSLGPVIGHEENMQQKGASHIVWVEFWEAILDKLNCWFTPCKTWKPQKRTSFTRVCSSPLNGRRLEY